MSIRVFLNICLYMNKAWGLTMFFKIPRQDTKATGIAADILESLSKPGQTDRLSKYTLAHTCGTAIPT